MSSILVASDLSERSDRAVQRALRLGRRLDRPVRILHVVDEDGPRIVQEPARVAAQAHLEAVVADAAAGAVTVEVRSGDPTVAILDAAEAAEASLVVLGLHRRRAILDQLRETTMERLVRASARPVLLVRDPASRDYRRALVPVDFSPACGRAVRAAHDLVAGGSLHLVHALHLPFAGLTGEGAGGGMARAVRAEAEAQCRAWLRQNPLPDDVEPPDIVAGSVTQIIHARLRDLAPDLLALGAHTRTSPSLFTLGGIAADLVRDPPCDLLLARPVAPAD